MVTGRWARIAAALLLCVIGAVALTAQVVLSDGVVLAGGAAEIFPSPISIETSTGTPSLGLFTVTSSVAAYVVPTLTDLTFQAVPGATTASPNPTPIRAAEILLEPANATLVANAPQVFHLTLPAVPSAGVFTGTVTVYVVPDPTRCKRSDPSCRPGQHSTNLTLTVKAPSPSAQPSVSPSPTPDFAGTAPTLKVRRVVCSNAVDCFLADQLLASEHSTTIPLELQNTGAVAVSINSVRLGALGDRSGATITASPLPSAALASPIPVGGFETVMLDVGTLPADHYAGAINIVAAGDDKAQSVALDLTVHDGPLWPLVWLFVGLGVGGFVRYMRSAGGDLATIQGRFVDVTRRTNGLDDSEPLIKATLLERANVISPLIQDGDLKAAGTNLDVAEESLEWAYVLEGLLLNNPNADAATKWSGPDIR